MLEVRYVSHTCIGPYEVLTVLCDFTLHVKYGPSVWQRIDNNMTLTSSILTVFLLL